MLSMWKVVVDLTSYWYGPAISAQRNRCWSKSAQVKISAGQNRPRSESVQGQNPPRSESAQFRIGAGQNRPRSESAQVRIGPGQNRPRSESAQVRIGPGQNRPRSESAQVRIGHGQNRPRSESAQVRIGPGQTWPRSDLAQVRIGPGQNRPRSESALVRIGPGQNRREKKMNQLYCIWRELKIKIVRKVLRLMVTRYVWNMIAFLRCHYAYLSIILTFEVTILRSTLNPKLRLKKTRLLSKKINISSK